MRRNLSIWALAGGILLFGVACSSEEHLPETGVQRIQFAISSATSPESRAVISGNYLPENDSVGVFAFSYDASSSSSWTSSPDLYNNAKGTASAVTGDPKKQSVILSSDKYYVGGRKHSFFSYYPYRDSLTAVKPVIAGDMFTDLESDGTQTDWLWADSITGVLATTSPVELVYSHMTSMIRVNVIKQKDVLDDIVLKLDRVAITTSSSQTFAFDVSKGKVTAKAFDESVTSAVYTNKFDAVTIPVSTGTALKVSEVLLLQESDITGLEFDINGETFNTPDTWTGFSTSVAGKYRVVNILIGMEEITIQLGGEEWVDGGDTDLSSGDVTISLGAKDWNYDPATDIDMTQAYISISLGAKGWTDYGESIVVNKK